MKHRAAGPPVQAARTAPPAGRERRLSCSKDTEQCRSIGCAFNKPRGPERRCGMRVENEYKLYQTPSCQNTCSSAKPGTVPHSLIRPNTMVRLFLRVSCLPWISKGCGYVPCSSLMGQKTSPIILFILEKQTSMVCPLNLEKDTISIGLCQ